MLLVVDHDPEFLERVQRLAPTSRGVFFARNAEHARDLMRYVGADFTLVMIDLDLSGRDGFSLIREMHQKFPELPVIATSGAPQDDWLQSARDLGAADALRKPITRAWRDAIPVIRAAANG